ncbi:hypothetical protein [Actinoplanes sp. NPDC049316]|uniref:hypothetical protein n=1 Tax=Actinoplanes sp. NPDC049316 TaxID=3154727 RepID=UPI00343296FD
MIVLSGESTWAAAWRRSPTGLGLIVTAGTGTPLLALSAAFKRVRGMSPRTLRSEAAAQPG